MTEKKGKTIYSEGRESVCAGNCQDNKPHELIARVAVCELEIKNLKYQFYNLCLPSLNKKKSSGIENLTIEELVNAGHKAKAAEKGFGTKLAGKFRKLINGK